MSNIYIQEPPTNGKIILKTTVGDIDIELWSREAPKAVRNFVQLCIEGYYNETIFHRVVKDFMVQGGDPTGTGMGGDSIYGQPFKDEFHSRLRFVRRGLVAMANAGKDDNGSQFFMTLGPSQELQNKHTIFGKVTGDTIYNMIRLGDSIVDQNERPLYPHKIMSVEVLLNPFDDIVPREKERSGKRSRDDEKKSKEKGTKNFNLLSFGFEAEEDEEQVVEANREFQGKGKSSHDLLKDDPKLSAEPAVDISELRQSKDDDDSDDEMTKRKDRFEKIKKKLKKRDDGVSSTTSSGVKEDDEMIVDEREESIKREHQKLSLVRNEFDMLKKQMCAELRKKYQKPINCAKIHENPAVAEFMEEAQKYKKAAMGLARKGASREQQALALLAKFKNRLLSSRKRGNSESEAEPNPIKDDNDKDDSWLCHELRCQKEDDRPILAKDANMRNEEDWYDIYDPRNPINKRRREEGIVGDKRKRV